MTITLNLAADNPADVADLINDVIRHPASEHTLRIDPDTGHLTITAAIHLDQVPATDDDVDELVRRTHADLPDPGFVGTAGLDSAGDVGENPDPEVVLDTLAELAAEEDDDDVVVDDPEPAGQDLDDAGDVPEEDPGEPDEPDHLDEPGGASMPLTCADAIVQLLHADRDLTWSIADIVDGIDGGYKQATVSFTLGELYRAGRILRAGRGLYQANPA